MDIDVFRPDELDTVFRVLRTALSPRLPLNPREKAFLGTYARIVGHRIDPPGPRPIELVDVRIADVHSRKRLVQLAVLAAHLSSPVRPSSVAFVRKLSQHLDVTESAVEVLEALRDERYGRVRFLVMRRMMGIVLREAIRTEGALGSLRFLGALFLKITVNKDKVWKYKRLGLLPEGTLGREFWKHLTERGFSFPGEPAGIPDAAAYHDVGHVLAGNDTTPLGEIQQASFQAGNRREDGFAFAQFAILQFHHGVRQTPIAPPETGNFDAEKVLWAIHRGAKCNVDITHQWDFWPLMSLPIDEARARCGLLPKLQPQVHCLAA
jgi:hypothetical protein